MNLTDYRNTNGIWLQQKYMESDNNIYGLLEFILICYENYLTIIDCKNEELLDYIEEKIVNYRNEEENETVEEIQHKIDQIYNKYEIL